MDYILYLNTSDINLNISLEQCSETLYWNSVFDSRYLEEITNKAGSFKTFEVFLKMLMSGLSYESDNVLVDLISYKDLEIMRNRKNNLQTSTNNLSESNNLSNDLSIINKKYLIISYSNEFEKVHYPLPINFIVQPEISLTLRTIERLKGYISKNIGPNSNIMGKSSNKINDSAINNPIVNIKDIEEIKSENQNLKNKLKLLESQRKLGAVENDEYLRNYSGIKEEYEEYKSQTEIKIKLLLKTIDDLKLKINYNIDTNENSENTNGNKTEKLTKTINDLENKLEKAEEIVMKERKTAQSYIEEKNREVEKIKKEIFFMKDNEKKLKVKINLLEKDLELANKRTNYSNNSVKAKSIKSNYSYKSSVKTSSSKSNYSKESANSKASNPYDKFKGLYNKNYAPFNFFNKNKNNSISKSGSKAGSYSGSSKGSIYSGAPKSIGSVSKKSNITNLNTNKYLKSPIASNLNKNKTNIYSKNSPSIIDKNKNIKTNNVKQNIYTKPSSITKNSYLKNNNSNKDNLAKFNKNNFITEKQKLNDKKLNESNHQNNISIKSNAFSKSSNKVNNDNLTNPINPEEINARLGRIQQLLDTAKI